MFKTVNEFQLEENEFSQLATHEQNNNHETKDQYLLKFEVNEGQTLQTQTQYTREKNHPLRPSSPFKFNEQTYFLDCYQHKYSISEGQKNQLIENQSMMIENESLSLPIVIEQKQDKPKKKQDPKRNQLTLTLKRFVKFVEPKINKGYLMFQGILKLRKAKRELLKNGGEVHYNKKHLALITQCKKSVLIYQYFLENCNEHAIRESKKIDKQNQDMHVTFADTHLKTLNL